MAYQHPETNAEYRLDELCDLPSEDQRLVVLAWFRERYEDPAESTPHDSQEGGYQFVHGGPYDARDVLTEEFESAVAADLLETIIRDLIEESPDWRLALDTPTCSAHEGTTRNRRARCSWGADTRGCSW